MLSLPEELAECVCLLSRGSLYTYEESIKNGYIPLPEGGRAGVCGEMLFREGRAAGIKRITSVNLRLHRLVRNFALPLLWRYEQTGLCGCIVYAPPAMGKTTFLRSAAVLLSEGAVLPPLKVAVADERSEILSVPLSHGLLDVVSGCPKAQAIELLTRTMSPDVILCDEIGAGEAAAVLEAQNTGVRLIASAHADSLEALRLDDLHLQGSRGTDAAGSSHGRRLTDRLLRAADCSIVSCSSSSV